MNGRLSIFVLVWFANGRIQKSLNDLDGRAPVYRMAADINVARRDVSNEWLAVPSMLSTTHLTSLSYIQ